MNPLVIVEAAIVISGVLMHCLSAKPEFKNIGLVMFGVGLYALLVTVKF